LEDGRYVEGYVEWYNTDVDEVPDRDLVLIRPSVVFPDGVRVSYEEAKSFRSVIISAREIRALWFSYLDPGPNDTKNASTNPSTKFDALLIGFVGLCLLAPLVAVLVNNCEN